MREKWWKQSDDQATSENARYELAERLGQGGMGQVFRAFDRLAQRQVAYKRLNVGADAARTRAAALFQREYVTLSRLSHPNIVQVYDYGFDADGPYYAMELLVGADLAQCGPLSFSVACGVLREVASALALLHARRLVHRDLSPQNVWLTTSGHAKLIDFGALMRFGKPRELVGTPAFIAPECVRDEALDQRTDLYGFGALAYWLLTRRTHHRARTIEDLPDAWQQAITPPSAYAPELPEAIDALVLSLLSVERDGRPTTAAEVVERLTSIAGLPPEQDESRVAVSYLDNPPLRGREQVISEFQHALHSANAGAGKILLIEAERGLGRSALLDRFTTDAQLAGAVVLRTAGGAHARPFAAMRQLSDTALALFPELSDATPLRGFSRHKTGGRRDLAQKALLSRSVTDASEQQARIASALSEALLRASRRNPLVLLVDDVHAIDFESLALLASMVDALHAHAIVLVLSKVAGDDRGGDALFKLVASARRAEIAPLAERDLGELVSTMFGGVPNSHRLASWLYTESGGNPAQALDLVRLLWERGAIRYTAGTFTLPHTYGRELADDAGEAQLVRLRGGGETMERVAELLAGHGAPLSPAELSRASGASARDVMLALEQLAARNLVAAHADCFALASETVRNALYRSLTAERTRALHLALARALGEPGEGVALERRLAVAGHLIAAGGEEAFEGACQLANLGTTYRFELAMMSSAHPQLEAALVLLQRRGYSDDDCTGLLVPLSVAGFYGSLELQNRYLDRAAEALSGRCGLTLTRRLTRFIGPKLALYVGMTCAFYARLFARKRLDKSSFLESLTSLLSIMGPAVAAAASTYDAVESHRIAGWLDVFAVAPRTSGLFGLREFCIATAEIISGKMQSAARRYAWLYELYEKPVFGMDDELRKQARLGCLHGIAQALVTDTDPVALQHATELEATGPFYGPHVECVRMTYHAYRGESERAAQHRARSEMLAFRGGTSWSALTSLTGRSIQTCVFTGDVIGLVHVISDLARLARLSPSLTAMHALAQAHLEVLRGRAEQALPTYDRVLASDEARALPSYAIERSFQADALLALGRHARAKQVCLDVIASEAERAQDFESGFRVPRQKLALAEAGLGNLARAAELLDGCFARASTHHNPLALGSLHRDRAYVAALSGDTELAGSHFEAMQKHFRGTGNPLLIRQCEAARAQLATIGAGQDTGLRATAQLAGHDDLDGKTVIEA